MNHARNGRFSEIYEDRLADLADRAEALRRLASTITVEAGTVAAGNLASARADLRLAIWTIAEAQQISEAVCIQLGSMSDRLGRIALMLDRGLSGVDVAGRLPVADLRRALAVHMAPMQLQ